MISRLRSSDGYAVATALILMTVMLTIGIAAMGFVDSETDASRRERTHESRLNLTEGVIAAEIFHLSRNWPAVIEKQFPESCTAASTDPKCPSPAQVKAQFSSSDVVAFSPDWVVTVRDDILTSQYYDDAAVQARPRYDENRNGEMWVRAQAELEGKERIVVARVRVEELPLRPPAAPFVAGKFNTGNDGGNKVIVQTTPGVYGVVRCEGDTTTHADACISYASGQLSPTNMVKSDINAGAAIPPGLQDSLKQMAINNGTYYPKGGQNCPTDPSGDVVWVETGSCKYTSGVVNGVTKKGIFIVNNGTLELAGNVEWWGVIYALNPQGCGEAAGATPCLTYKGYSDNVVTITGTPTVHGGIFVDGAGRLGIGNSGNAGACAQCLPNLMYDASVVLNLTAYGTAGIIQNTWREIPPAAPAP